MANQQNEFRDFFRFTVGQAFTLVILASLLCAVYFPFNQRIIDDWRADIAARKYAAAQTLFRNAIESNDPTAAKSALKAGAIPDVISYGANVSTLEKCITLGHVEIVRLILEHQEESKTLNQVKTQWIEKAFHVAIEAKLPSSTRLQLMQLLIDHGVDIHAEIYRRTAMDVAAHAGEAQSVDMLRGLGLPYGVREMASLNRLDELVLAFEAKPALVTERFRPYFHALPGQNPTLLGIALEKGYVSMAEFLIEKGASLDVLEYEGETMLHRAVRGGNPKLIKFLIDRGLDVNAKTSYGEPILHFAVYSGHSDAVAALLAGGAHVDTLGVLKESALHLAVTGNHTGIADLLIKAVHDCDDSNGPREPLNP